jgi:hypothetical protein
MVQGLGIIEWFRSYAGFPPPATVTVSKAAFCHCFESGFSVTISKAVFGLARGGGETPRTPSEPFFDFSYLSRHSISYMYRGPGLPLTVAVAAAGAASIASHHHHHASPAAASVSAARSATLSGLHRQERRSRSRRQITDESRWPSW